MTSASQLKRASAVLATIIVGVAYIVIADGYFRLTIDHTLRLGHCLRTDPWKDWGPLAAGSVALFGLSVLSLIATRSLGRKLRVVLLVPVLLYSLWLGLWGMVVQILSLDDGRLTSSPALISLVQGLLAVSVQLRTKPRSMKVRVSILAIVFVGVPTIWFPLNYVLGQTCCG